MTVTDPEVAAEARRIARSRAGAKAHLKGPEKAVVRTLVARAVAEGWDQATLAKRLEQSVGLDARFTTAVETYRKGLLAKGMPPGKAQVEAKKYAGRLRAYRANLIARQERSEAIGDAQRKVWADRQIAKVYSRWAVRVFRVHKDERLCPVCRPMNGKRASLRHGSLYKGTPHAGPPLHVGCRCHEEILDEGLVKTDPDLWGPGEEEIEKRAQPRVRTQAGMRRYGLPLLAPIVARPHRYPDLDDDAQYGLDRLLDDGRPHVRAFGYAIRDVLDRYPALSAYIGWVDEADKDRKRDDPPYVAWVGPDAGSSGKLRVSVSDRYMREAFEEFEEKIQSTEGRAYLTARGVPNRATMSGPDIERYAYAVGIHEMGHVAHGHFIAAGLRYARPENIRRYEEKGHRLGDQPVVSEYAKRSAMEQFAEWFAGNLLGLNPGNDAKFKAEFEAAMVKRAVWDETMYVVKGQHPVEDFKGSLVERYAMGQGTPLGLVSKARQRYVRTAAGSRRFKLPIGAPIPVGGRALRGILRQVPALRFLDSFAAAFPPDSPFRNHVSHYSRSDIRRARMTPLTAYQGKAGCLVHDHGDGRVEATALFNNGGPKGAGLEVLRGAVENYGVNYVEAFGPILPKLYAQAGFVETDVFAFDPDQAPEGWDYERFDHPTYHLMTLGGTAVAKGAYWTDEQIDDMWERALREAYAESGDEQRQVWDALVQQASTQF